MKNKTFILAILTCLCACTQIKDEVSDLPDMSSVNKSLEEILSMIQSITVVPDYSDGYVNASYGNDATVDFEIFPLSAAEALAGNWSGAVSLRAVYTEPATKSSHTFVDLPVSNVTYADGIVTVTYNSTGLSAEFWNESATANARLLISDGNNCVASQYYLLRPLLDFSSATDLSSDESANSYIVSSVGAYKFKTTKGNSTESVGNVSSCEVLWETFGTSTAPKPGDLIVLAQYEAGNIHFFSSSNKGNAVIAAKDESGNILWSWHIWMTDEPQEQVYNNNAGTMMDRNLGATSATPGDVGALGLLYQWGRKDPFLGSSSISSNTEAMSTITWPSAVESNNSTGTIDYATANPTTFITYNGKNHDWYYTGDSSTDDTRWQSSKTIYDPCPAGWRVPDGGGSGVWATAFGTSSGWTTASNWDSTNLGMDFSNTDKTLGSSEPIWYPASGYRDYRKWSISDVGSYGIYWSVSPYDRGAYRLGFSVNGGVDPAYNSYRAYGQSVRCLQE